MSDHYSRQVIELYRLERGSTVEYVEAIYDFAKPDKFGNPTLINERLCKVDGDTK